LSRKDPDRPETEPVWFNVPHIGKKEQKRPTGRERRGALGANPLGKPMYGKEIKETKKRFPVPQKRVS